MAAKRAKVTYRDGREFDIKIYPDAQVMAEKYVGGLSPQTYLLSSYYMGWAALRESGKESADFDSWLKLVDDCVAIEDEPGPTQPDPSGSESSGSAS